MYSRSIVWHKGKVPHTASGAGRRTQRRSTKERKRLNQLLICLALFLAVFLGKGIFPASILQVQQQLREIILSDTDFRSAFMQLGYALSERGPILDDLSEFCIEVFGAQTDIDSPTPDWCSPFEQEQEFLNSQLGQAQVAAHYLRMEQTPSHWFIQPVQQPQEEQALPAVGTILVKSDYNGHPLPENYTMDELSLGGLETYTPITGRLWSEFGYRDHPIDGEYKFHNGIDIGGQVGDPIGAFADGRVDFIGESNTYGLYLQLDHGNGIKSFYAHCSKLCVSKGELVAAGEKVAEVGATGTATGPHLHLELKLDGTHLNPAYYIDL